MKDVKIISAAVAMLKVIEAYGVKQIYGYPGGSINSTLHALDEEKIILNTFKFVTNKLVLLQPPLMLN